VEVRQIGDDVVLNMFESFKDVGMRKMPHVSERNGHNDITQMLAYGRVLLNPVVPITANINASNTSFPYTQ
jgi:hypothetical protein